METLEEDESTYYEEPFQVELDDIEGRDPARARFIKHYLEESTI